MNKPAALELRSVARHFEQGGRRLDVLKDASLSLHAGELSALVGPSGSGKSTLLNIAGLLEAPDMGAVYLDGENAYQKSQRHRTKLRRHKIGFVFQFHRLLPEFSALENIMIPQMIAGLSKSEAQSRAADLLAMVGLSDRAKHRPGLLSGGEQQRVAIARAMANAPSVLLADEPTGNLDPETAAEVFSHLRQIAKAVGTAALIVTHNLELAGQMDRRLTLTNGQITELGQQGLSHG